LRYFFLYDEVMNSARKSFFTSPSTFLQFVNLLVWAGVAYIAVVLVLRWSGGAEEGVPLIAGIEQKKVSPDVDALSVSKALGAAPVQSASASLASRFVLVGVMDGGPSQGVALISVDGKPAKPYRVGQTVSEGFVIVGTGPKKAELGPQLGAAATLLLELPLKK
jgi:general secretion pathway protein C